MRRARPYNGGVSALNRTEDLRRSDGCLDDHLVAALADGTLPRELHVALLPHLLDCPDCQSAVGGAAATVASDGVAREMMPVHGKGSWRRRLGIAAAAAVVLILAWPGDSGRLDPHRGETVTAGSEPVGIGPVGDAGAADALVWHSAPGAQLYRVVLFGESGDVLFEQETHDTTAGLPDSVPLAPGGAYLWRVDARVGWDRWTSSELLRFRLPQPNR